MKYLANVTTLQYDIEECTGCGRCLEVCPRNVFTIEDKKARIAVVGLGYVGLPLAVAFAQKGFKVLGIDTDADRIGRIGNLKSYNADVSNACLGRIIRKKLFSVSLDFDLLDEADVGVGRSGDKAASDKG